MLLEAATQSPVVPLISLSIGILGVVGLIFTALRFRRDDTTAIVQQQSVVFDDLKALNEELRTTVTMLRVERDTQKAKASHYEGQIEALRVELREARAQLVGKMTKIERKDSA
jgi:predicted phage gp36 major capsid-like protein